MLSVFLPITTLVIIFSFGTICMMIHAVCSGFHFPVSFFKGSIWKLLLNIFPVSHLENEKSLFIIKLLE